MNQTLKVLRFFWNSPQGAEADVTGYKGFYYHFLDMQTGKRAWKCELSLIDTTFLLAGMLTAAAYFAAPVAEEVEIRAHVEWLQSQPDRPGRMDLGRLLRPGSRNRRNDDRKLSLRPDLEADAVMSAHSDRLAPRRVRGGMALNPISDGKAAI